MGKSLIMKLGPGNLDGKKGDLSVSSQIRMHPSKAVSSHDKYVIVQSIIFC